MSSHKANSRFEGRGDDSQLTGSRSQSRLRVVAPSVSHIVPNSAVHSNDLSRDKVVSRRRTARSAARSQDPRTRVGQSVRRSASKSNAIEQMETEKSDRNLPHRSPSNSYGTFKDERIYSSSRAGRGGEEAPLLHDSRPLALPRSQYDKCCRSIQRFLEYTVTGVEVTFFHIRFVQQQCLIALFISILDLETGDSLSFLNFSAPKEWADLLFPTGQEMDVIPPILLTGSSIEEEFSRIVASNSRFLFSNDATESIYIDPAEMASFNLDPNVHSDNITALLPNTFLLDNHIYRYNSFSSFLPWSTSYQQCISPSSMYVEVVGKDQYQVQQPVNKQSRLQQLKLELSENALMETKYLSLYRPHSLEEASGAFQKLLLLYGSVALNRFNNSDIGQSTLMNTHAHGKKSRPVYAQVHLDTVPKHMTWNDPLLLNTILQWSMVEFNLGFLTVNHTVWIETIRSCAQMEDQHISSKARNIVDKCKNDGSCIYKQSMPYPLPFLLINSHHKKDINRSRASEVHSIDKTWQKLPMLKWQVGLKREQLWNQFQKLQTSLLLNEAAVPLEQTVEDAVWSVEETLVAFSAVKKQPLSENVDPQGMLQARRRQLAQMESLDTPLPLDTDMCGYMPQETNIPRLIGSNGMQFGDVSYYASQSDNLPKLCAIASSFPLAHSFMQEESQLYTYSTDNYIREKLHNVTQPASLTLAPRIISTEGDVIFPGSSAGKGQFQPRIQHSIAEQSKHVHPASDQTLVCIPCANSYSVDPVDQFRQPSGEEEQPDEAVIKPLETNKKFVKKVKKHSDDPNFQAHQNTTMYRNAKISKLSPLYLNWQKMDSKQRSLVKKISKKTKLPLQTVLQHLSQGELAMGGIEPAYADPVKDQLKLKIHGSQWGRTSKRTGAYATDTGKSRVFRIQGSSPLFSDLTDFKVTEQSVQNSDILTILLEAKSSSVRSISLLLSLQNVQFVEGRRTCAQWDVQLSAFRTLHSSLLAGLAHRFQPCRVRSMRKKARRSNLAQANLRDEALAQDHQSALPVYAETGVVSDPLYDRDTVQVTKDTPSQYILLIFIAIASTVTLIWRVGSVLLTRQIDQLADIEKVLFFLNQNENVEDYLIVTGITEDELRDTYIAFVEKSACLIVNTKDHLDYNFTKTTVYFCDGIHPKAHHQSSRTVTDPTNTPATITAIPTAKAVTPNYLLQSRAATQEYLRLFYPSLPATAVPIPTKQGGLTLPRLPSILRNLYYPKLGWLFYSYALQDIIVYTFLILYFISNVANTGANYDFSATIAAKAQATLITTNHSNAWLKLAFALFGWAAATLFISFVTLFPYRYIVMSKAVASAIPLLISFGVVMVPLAIAFVMFAYTAFHNYDDPRYLSIGMTATSLFAMMCGDNILASFTHQSKSGTSMLIVSRVFFYTFCFLFTMFLYRLLLVVLEFFVFLEAPGIGLDLRRMSEMPADMKKEVAELTYAYKSERIEADSDSGEMTASSDSDDIYDDLAYTSKVFPPNHQLELRSQKIEDHVVHNELEAPPLSRKLTQKKLESLSTGSSNDEEEDRTNASNTALMNEGYHAGSFKHRFHSTLQGKKAPLRQKKEVGRKYLSEIKKTLHMLPHLTVDDNLWVMGSVLHNKILLPMIKTKVEKQFIMFIIVLVSAVAKHMLKEIASELLHVDKYAVAKKAWIRAIQVYKQGFTVLYRRVLLILNRP